MFPEDEHHAEEVTVDERGPPKIQLIVYVFIVCKSRPEVRKRDGCAAFWHVKGN